MSTTYLAIRHSLNFADDSKTSLANVWYQLIFLQLCHISIPRTGSDTSRSSRSRHVGLVAREVEEWSEFVVAGWWKLAILEPMNIFNLEGPNLPLNLIKQKVYGLKWVWKKDIESDQQDRPKSGAEGMGEIRNKLESFLGFYLLCLCIKNDLHSHIQDFWPPSRPVTCQKGISWISLYCASITKRAARTQCLARPQTHTPQRLCLDLHPAPLLPRSPTQTPLKHLIISRLPTSVLVRNYVAHVLLWASKNLQISRLKQFLMLWKARTSLVLPRQVPVRRRHLVFPFYRHYGRILNRFLLLCWHPLG